MATKSNTAVSIDREAVLACAECAAAAVKDLSPLVSQIEDSIKYLCDPEELEGSDIEQFQKGVDHLGKMVTIIMHRLEKLSQAFARVSEKYNAGAKITKRKLEDAQAHLDAVRAKVENTTNK